MIPLALVPLVVRRWVCGGYLVLIAVLSLVPAWLFPPSVSQIPGIDKWVHVAMYGVLGALLRWASGLPAPARASRWLPAAGALYGVLMEVLQLTLSGASRGFSWGDILANTVGIAVGWLVMRRLLGRSNIHKT